MSWSSDKGNWKGDDKENDDFHADGKGFPTAVNLKLDLCEFCKPFISNWFCKFFDNHVNWMIKGFHGKEGNIPSQWNNHIENCNVCVYVYENIYFSDSK